MFDSSRIRPFFAILGLLFAVSSPAVEQQCAFRFQSAPGASEGSANRAFLLSDPGDLDLLTVDLAWGDGTSERRTVLAGSELSHVCADDGTYDSSVGVRDDDDPTIVSDAFQAVVANVAPVISVDTGFSLPIEWPSVRATPSG